MKRRDFLRTTAVGTTVLAGGFTLLPSLGKNALHGGISPAPTTSHQIGSFTRPWMAAPVDRALDGVKQSGFRLAAFTRIQKKFPIGFYNPGQDAAYIGRLLEERNLKLVMVYFGTDLSESPKASMTAMLPVFDALQKLKVPFLLSGGARKTLKNQYYEAMKYWADETEKRGIKLLLKPHGGLSANGAECAEAVQKVNSDNFRISYDPGNVLYYTGKDPAEDVKDVAEWVVAMSFKDCKRKGLEKPTVAVTPGDGEVDFQGIIDVLKKYNYHGPTLVETLAGSSLQEIDKEGIRAYQYMQKIFSTS